MLAGSSSSGDSKTNEYDYPVPMEQKLFELVLGEEYGLERRVLD